MDYEQKAAKEKSLRDRMAHLGTTDPAKRSELQAELVKLAATPPVKKYFDIRVEAVVDCAIQYRVLAGTPEEALEQFNRTNPVQVRPNTARKRISKATVYDSGSTVIRLIKRFTK